MTTRRIAPLKPIRPRPTLVAKPAPTPVPERPARLLPTPLPAPLPEPLPAPELKATPLPLPTPKPEPKEIVLPVPGVEPPPVPEPALEFRPGFGWYVEGKFVGGKAEAQEEAERIKRLEPEPREIIIPLVERKPPPDFVPRSEFEGIPIVPELPEGEQTTLPNGLIMVTREGFPRTYWREVKGGFIKTDQTGIAVIPIYDRQTWELRLALREYAGLEGKEQFERGIDIGLFPSDSVYVPGVKPGEWSFITRLQADDLRKRSPKLYKILTTKGWDAYEAELEKSGAKLSEFITKGELDVVGAVTAGFTIDDMRDAGFNVTGGDIKAVQEYNVALAEYDAALEELQPVLDAIRELQPFVMPARFSDKEVQVAVEALQKWSGEKIEAEEYRRLTGDFERYNLIEAASSLPFDKIKAIGITKEEYDEARDLGKLFKEGKYNVETAAAGEPPSLLSSIWVSLTSWKEEKGETFLDYIKERPKKFLSPDIPSQEELKARYEADQAAPLWSRLLFGSSVAYDKKSDTYFPLVVAEYPTGKKGAGVAATKVLTKTIEVNWNKLLPPKVSKPQVNWNNIVNAIKSGRIKTAQDAARWAAAQEKWFPKTTLKPTSPEYAEWMRQLTAQGLKDAAAAAARSRQMDVLSGLRVALIPAAGSPVDWKPFKPSELTPDRMKELIADWTKMKPSEALSQINDANLVSAVAAYQPDYLIRLLSQVTPAQSTKTITRLQPSIQTAIKTKNLTKVKELAQTQLAVKNQLALTLATILATATATATKTMFESLTKGLTSAKTQAAVETAVKEAIATKIQTTTGLQPATTTELELATEGITQTAIHVAEQSVVGVKPPEIVKPERKPPPPPPPPLLPRPSDEAKRKIIKKAGGAIAWRMGELQGRDIFHVIKHPYASEDDYLTVVGRKPAGATVAKGKGSAFRTIRVLHGKRPAKAVHVDIGIQDVLITPRDRGVTIGFTPDPGQKTTGDITVGRGRLRLTSPLPALSKAGRPRLTAKRPSLRR